MQAEYPRALPTVKWDTVNVQYPVRKFPDTGISSEAIVRKCRGQPEVLKNLRDPVYEVRQYNRDYNVTKELTKSVTAQEYGYKHPETVRHNKHSSCTENHYIYPLARKIEDRPPQCRAHGTTEMRNAYKPPTVFSRLVTDKDQFKHPLSLPEPEIEPSWLDPPEPLDTTYEGFEKLLDPYLTTSRLHHRPFTAEQLSRPSASKDTITYYTQADLPWVRSPKPQTDWRSPVSSPKSMYDSRTFKQDCREIRTHNNSNWVPGSFRTEVRDNYTPITFPHPHQIQSEADLRISHKRSLGQLPATSSYEQSTIEESYSTEASVIGSGKRLCSAIDQYIERNKRLERQSMRIG